MSDDIFQGAAFPLFFYKVDEPMSGSSLQSLQGGEYLTTNVIKDMTYDYYHGINININIYH